VTIKHKLKYKQSFRQLTDGGYKLKIMTEKKPYYKTRNEQVSSIEQINTIYGKLPPQAIEVEEAVLGAVMLEQEAIYKVSPILAEEAFYKDEHQKIYRTVLELANINHKIDLMVVTQRLKDKGMLEEIGGPAYIMQLTRRVASAAHIEHHARIIAQKFFQREVIRRCTELISKAYDDDMDELDAMYNMHTQAIDDMLAGKTGMMHIREILEDTTRDLNDRQKLALSGATPGVTTGLADLNELNNGWQPGDLIILAARPSMGKTAIAINLFAKAAANRGKTVCIFSLEMENLKLSKRLILSYGGIVRTNFERGTMTTGDWNAFNQAKQELGTLPIYIDDTPGTTVRYIDAVIRNKARKGECDLVIIDYLQLVESPETWGNKNREREVAEISRGLKKVAKAAGVPIILLAQLNRGVENREDKTPRLADLRESGAIEQDADIVMFPWRPCYYDPAATDDNNNSLDGVILLEIAKYRDGRVGTVLAKHNPDLTQFFDFNTKQFEEPKFW
jgi:replicative DNA helicase